MLQALMSFQQNLIALSRQEFAIIHMIQVRFVLQSMLVDFLTLNKFVKILLTFKRAFSSMTFFGKTTRTSCSP